MYYTKFDLCNSPIDKNEVFLKNVTKKKQKKAPESINLQFAVESATFHLFTCQIKAIIPSSNVIYKIIHGSNLNTQLITEYSNCFMSFQTLIIF